MSKHSDLFVSQGSSYAIFIETQIDVDRLLRRVVDGLGGWLHVRDMLAWEVLFMKVS